MTPDLSLLHGEVLVSGMQLEAFSAASLPSRPAERFAALFAHRQQWAADDLKPYIASLEVRRCASMRDVSDAGLVRVAAKEALLPGFARSNCLPRTAGAGAIDRVSAAAVYTRHAARCRQHNQLQCTIVEMDHNS